MDNKKDIMILAGSTNVPLAEKIASELKLPLTERDIEMFPNGEIGVEIKESVAGAEVFIIETLITGNVNDNFVESLLLIDAAKRARASKVYLVQAMMPYQRQDRRETNKRNRPKRRPLSGRVIADCYSQAVHLDGLIVVKLHSDQIEGFFSNNCIVENIDPSKLFVQYLKSIGVINGQYEGKAPVVVAPDVGSAKSADEFSNAINLEYVLMNKRRIKAGESKVMHVIGDHSERDCIIYDDMIDTGGTVLNALEKLREAKEQGAKNVYLMSPHGVFSRDAIEKLGNSTFTKIVITDSIPNPDLAKYSDKFEVITLAPFLAKVIANVHNSESLQQIVEHEEM